MPVVTLLRRLQSIDLEWDEKAPIFQRVRQQLGDQSELLSKRGKVEELAARLERTRGDLQDAELRLGSLQAKSKQVDQELYGGKVTSSRELENLQQEREMLRRRMSETEDEALSAMALAEELAQQSAESTQELARFETAYEHERDQLTHEYRELGRRLQQLQADREALRETLGSKELGLYDELRRLKSGQALSALLGSTCATCRVTVSSNKSEMVRRGDSIVVCDGCGRILYIA